MAKNLAHKIISAHLVSGQMKPGNEIGIKIDQTLMQDATGTMVMLELEAMGLDRAKTEIAVQYVDHNLIQEDFKNPDDHLFLHSACQKFGIYFSRPGNGVSHPVHQEVFGKPGKTLLGSDSHTPSAGGIGMLAIGAGGLEVALAIAGEPFHLKMPQIMGVKLFGTLPKWVSAKDVILELLRRHDVSGGLGKIIEYYGPGIEQLDAFDRHVICNMGAELGATTSVFPSDNMAQKFFASQKRDSDWMELKADSGADYDLHEEIDLSKLEPLIAMPSSPGNVVSVKSVAGQKIYQSYVGSSANPGFRDFAIVAEIVREKVIPAHVSFDINPASRLTLDKIIKSGYLNLLIRAGARLHQTGCGGCIGMGQAPASNEISLRTVPRNFPGRSGTADDKVCLVSPETAAASALAGVITDPRTLSIKYPEIQEPDLLSSYYEKLILPPLPLEDSRKIKLRKGPNIAELPTFLPCKDTFAAPVILKVGDNISTDTILPAGAHVLPYRSNIPKISEFAFSAIDPDYHKKAMAVRTSTGHIIVAGKNYGQGSSREHAAMAPRYLGLTALLAVSFARIHWENLINFGVLPLEFSNKEDWNGIANGDIIEFSGIQNSLRAGKNLVAFNKSKNHIIPLVHKLSERQIDLFKHGGLIAWMKARNTA